MEPDNVLLSLSGEATVDDLLSLRNWLGGEQEFRGRLSLSAEEASEARILSGGLVEAISVSIAPGVPVALAAIITSWLRNRTSNIKVTVTRVDGSTVEVDGARVKKIDHDSVQQLAREIEGGAD